MIKKYFISLALVVGLNNCAYDFSVLDSLLTMAIEQRIFPGAVVYISARGECVYHKAFGNYTYDGGSAPISEQTLFDCASLTKVLVTTTLAAFLVQEGQLDISLPVAHYIPEFAQSGKEAITLEHLLLHESGIEDIHFFRSGEPLEMGFERLCEYVPHDVSGSAYCYSDANMILLQQCIERVTHLSLDQAFERYVRSRLASSEVQFNPADRGRCAPTERDLQGVVQDRQAQALGGVAGHAGVFATARGVAQIGELWAVPGSPLSKDEVTLWTQERGTDNRGYGWEMGRYWGPRSYGHLGWSGTSLTIDPDLNLVCVLLTNRTYPDDTNFVIRPFRILFHNLVRECYASAGSAATR